MQGNVQKKGGDADINSFGKVMNENSKQGNPRGADKGGLAAGGKTMSGSIESDKVAQQNNVTTDSSIDTSGTVASDYYKNV